jgi:hypothetical protein
MLKRANVILEALKRKLKRLADYVQSILPAPEVEIDGRRLRGTPTLIYYQVHAGRGISAVYMRPPMLAEVPHPNNSTSMRFLMEPSG